MKIIDNNKSYTIYRKKTNNTLLTYNYFLNDN